MNQIEAYIELFEGRKLISGNKVIWLAHTGKGITISKLVDGKIEMVEGLDYLPAAAYNSPWAIYND